MLEYFLLNSQIHHQRQQESFRCCGGACGALCRPRCAGDCARSRYAFPWELWLARTTERLVLRRSLVTGQELAKGAGKCMLKQRRVRR